MKWLLILLLGVVIIPTFAQSTTINQTEYQNLEASINATRIELHNEHTGSDVLSLGFAIIPFVGSLIFAVIVARRQNKQADKVQTVVTKIKEIEDKQKAFLEELERTRTSRINFYGTKLVSDFTTIQKYFENMEKLPSDRLKKLTPIFFANFGIAHVITLKVDDSDVEIPNMQYFEVMKEDLRVIESDLSPDISYYVGKTIEITQMCFVPISNHVEVNNNLWTMAKQQVITSIDRLNSIMPDKKLLKDYGVRFVRRAAETPL